jgi:aspartyl-tRNA(Asn)/glutamyl-tRNA(Gln) amidotransferase subunit C
LSGKIPRIKEKTYSSNGDDIGQDAVYHFVFGTAVVGADPLSSVTDRSVAVSLTRQQVEHIANLARLEFDEAEIPDFVAKLGSIVDFVDQLQQADTDSVEPMAHPLDQVQRLRPDEVTEAVDRDAYQNNAPAVADGMYLVPKVIE